MSVPLSDVFLEGSQVTQRRVESMLNSWDPVTELSDEEFQALGGLLTEFHDAAVAGEKFMGMDPYDVGGLRGGLENLVFVWREQWDVRSVSDEDMEELVADLDLEFSRMASGGWN